MKPVSTGIVRPPTDVNTVFEWPPTRSERSYTVTSWRWLRSQAAESPEIPVPMTATLRRRLSRMFGENPVAIPRTNRPGIGLFWPISLSKRSNPSFRSPAGDPNGRTWRFSNHAFRRSITLSNRRTHGRCDDLAVESAQFWYTEAFIRHAR